MQIIILLMNLKCNIIKKKIISSYFKPKHGLNPLNKKEILEHGLIITKGNNRTYTSAIQTGHVDTCTCMRHKKIRIG